MRKAFQRPAAPPSADARSRHEIPRTAGGEASARTAPRWSACAASIGTAALIAGCATSAPPPQLYQLRAAPPVSVPAVAESSLNWQLLQPVKLPEYLDRDALLVAQGQSGLVPLPGHRWAEPLRDSVPRVLRQDLAALLGESRVWTAPVPAAIPVARRLRVELLAFEATADRAAVVLRARWSVVDPSGATPPRAEAVTLTVPSAGDQVDQLVAAHRLALWRLAERIVAAP